MDNKLKTFDEVIKHLNESKREKHLLLGNGFSMSYDSEIFFYNALNRFIEKLDNEVIDKLFKIINTKNFEIVMQQLDNFCEIANAFGSDKVLVEKIKDASTTLKNSLISAIEELHPEHVFTIPEKKSQSCASFLSCFTENQGNIFTTNYDLLLYWVLMRNGSPKSIDGFGRDRENPDEYVQEDELEYSELRLQKPILRTKLGRLDHYNYIYL